MFEQREGERVHENNEKFRFLSSSLKSAECICAIKRLPIVDDAAVLCCAGREHMLLLKLNFFIFSCSS